MLLLNSTIIAIY